MPMTIDEVVARLDGVVKHDDTRYSARCPAHDDRTASLAVSMGDKGGVVVHCFACEDQDVVLDALEVLGIKRSDLAPPGDSAGGKTTKGRLLCTYLYRDLDGTILHAKDRFQPKRFTQKRPDGSGGWAYDLKGVRQVLYHLPEIAAAPADAWILVVEGEKDADNAAALGFVATCNAGGAGKWKQVDDAVLRGRRVAIIADKDVPGRKHAVDVGMSLLGHCPDLKLVEMPGDKVKDLTDWISAGGTRDQLLALIDAAEQAAPTNLRYPEDPPRTSSATPARLKGSKGKVSDDPYDLARDAIVDLWFDDGRCLIRHWDEAFYVWSSEMGCYKVASVDDLHSSLVRWCGNHLEKTKRSNVDDILAIIRALVHLPKDLTIPSITRYDPDTAKMEITHLSGDWLPLTNGLFRLDSLVPLPNRDLPRVEDAELHEINADIFLLHRLKYAYDPEVEPKVWYEFLATIWPGGSQNTNAFTLGEWFGYILTSDTKHEKIMCLEGPRRAGKGTITSVLTELVGEYQTGATSLMSLASQFGLENIYRKPLVVAGEAHLGHGTDAMAVLDRLKSIVGRDIIRIDQKYKPPISVRPVMRFTLSFNMMPKLSDESLAIVGRLLLLTFRESFFGREDTSLRQRLLEPDSLSGILNWTLDNLCHLRANGRFTESEESRLALERVCHDVSPTLEFVNDCCDVSADAAIEKDALWVAWRTWAGQNGHAAGSRSGFFRRLHTTIPKGLVEYRPIMGNSRKQCISGIRLATQ